MKVFKVEIFLNQGTRLEADVIAASHVSATNKARRLVPRTIRASTLFHTYLKSEL